MENIHLLPKTDSGAPTLPPSSHPAILSPGLESLWNSDQGKEVVSPERLPQYQDVQHKTAAPYYEDAFPRDDRTRRRICGLPALLFCIILASFVLLAVVLGIGLGVGLNKR